MSKKRVNFSPEKFQIEVTVDASSWEAVPHRRFSCKEAVL